MKNLIILFILIVASSFGNETYKSYKEGEKLYVWVKNGLNLRKEPNLNSESIGLLEYGTEITVLTQNNKVYYEYPFIEVNNINFEENSSKKPIFLKGYWIKIKSKNSSGYVFSGLLLKYKPYRALNFYEEVYLSNYFQEMFKMNFIKDDIWEVDSYTKELYGCSKGYSQLFQSTNKDNLLELNTEELNKIEISNMSFQEALVFFILILPPAEGKFVNIYEAEKTITYQIPLGHPKSGATILEKGNKIYFDWMIVPWD